MFNTLQRYICWEMGKTFVLTTIGLTIVLSTCGGIYNLTRLSDITPRQTAILLLMVVPLFAAFSLPIAALFSATLTYGRMAADNEIMACRGSGIGTRMLFAPCMVISVLSAGLTFVLLNFVIPELLTQMQAQLVSQTGISTYVSQQVKRGLNYQNLRIYAEQAEPVPVPSGRSNLEAVILKGVVFLTFANDELLRMGTCDSAALKFDLNRQPPVFEAELDAFTGINFSANRAGVPETGSLRLGPYELPTRGVVGRRRVGFQTLGRLWYFLDHLEEGFSKVSDELKTTREMIFEKTVLDDVRHDLSQPDGIVLEGTDYDLRLQSSQSELRYDPDHQRNVLELTPVLLTQRGDSNRLSVSYRAAVGTISLQPIGENEFGLYVHLVKEVQVAESTEPGTSMESSRPREWGPLHLPTAVQATLQNPLYRPTQLMNSSTRLGLGPEIDAQHRKLLGIYSKYWNDIITEIHVRSVYSVSVLVLAVLGAALGIIFRGGQPLVAFGISFVPSLIVFLLTVLGKGMARDVASLPLGLAVMWGGLLTVAMLNVVVFRRYLPR